jgi:hypothetical protein
MQCSNASDIEVVAMIRHVFLLIVAKMSDRSDLEQRINIKCCVKLGNFLSKLIPGDETRCFQQDSERKR